MDNLINIDEACDLLIAENLMTEDDKKPLMKWFDKFERALKKRGVTYAKSKIKPTDAVEKYYDKVSPEDAAKQLSGVKEAMSDADLKRLGIDNPLKDKGYPYQKAAEGDTDKPKSKDAADLSNTASGLQSMKRVKEDKTLHSTGNISEQRSNSMFKGEPFRKQEFEGLYKEASSIMANTRETRKNLLPDEVIPYIQEGRAKIVETKAMTPKDRKSIAAEMLAKAQEMTDFTFTPEMIDAFNKNLGV